MRSPDPAMEWTEADVTINGVELSFGQSMALRVAASSMMMELMDEYAALADDATGRGIAKGYRERLSEVLALMIGDRNR